MNDKFDLCFIFLFLALYLDVALLACLLVLNKFIIFLFFFFHFV